MNSEGLVIPVLLGTNNVDVSINARFGHDLAAIGTGDLVDLTVIVTVVGEGRAAGGGGAN